MVGTHVMAKSLLQLGHICVAFAALSAAVCYLLCTAAARCCLARVVRRFISFSSMRRLQQQTLQSFQYEYL